jgi:hypothetical protein
MRCELPADRGSSGLSSYRPPSALAEGSFLIVRRSALDQLAAELSPSSERPVAERERTTLLVLIAALAERAKIDITKLSNLPWELFVTLTFDPRRRFPVDGNRTSREGALVVQSNELRLEAAHGMALCTRTGGFRPVARACPDRGRRLKQAHSIDRHVARTEPADRHSVRERPPRRSVAHDEGCRDVGGIGVVGHTWSLPAHAGHTGRGAALRE